MITGGLAGRPSGWAAVNPRAPYADKVVGAYLFACSSGGLSPDLTGRTHLYHNPLGVSGPTPAPFGVGLYSANVNATFMSDRPPPYVGAVAIGGVLTGNSGNGIVMGQGADNFAMAAFEWGIFVSSGAWRFGYGFTSSSGSGTPAPLGRFDVGLSRNAGVGYGYVGGVQVNSGGSGGAGLSTNPIRGSTGSTGTAFAGALDYAILFGCHLPPEAFAEVRRNPYQYFQTARRSLWPAPGAAPARKIPWHLFNRRAF